MSADPWTMAGASGRRHDALLPDAHAVATDPGARAVPTARLLDHLGLEGNHRQEAEATLRGLADRLLALPTAPGGGGEAQVVVPNLLHRQAAGLAGLGRPVDQLLSQGFQAAEIQKIHRALALPADSRTRDERQREITALLSKPHKVRALAVQAPPQAHDLLDRLVDGPPLLRTHCFHSRYGSYYATDTGPFVFRPEGSGDPGTDWLAAHGLVIPVGHDLAELPYEVGHALRDPDARPTYRPAPPPVPNNGARPAPAPIVLREAQAAASSAAGRVELLLRHVDTTPLSVRKAGGIAVRDTRRAAKHAGLDEQQARFWLDLAANAGLLGVRTPEPAPTGRGRSRRPAAPTSAPQVLPTQAYDGWLADAPARRLAPLIATWTAVPEILTWWPDPDQDTPVALVTPQDPLAVPLRTAVLEALAALPDHAGIDTTSEPGADWLAHAVTWHRPAALTDPGELDERLTATLTEAHLLGIAAHGALTPLGHATLDLLHTGAARYYPAIPGTGPCLDQHPRLTTALTRLYQTLDQLLPTPATTARFQTDLTAVVAGAPSAELTDLLGSCADRESEGHAVVWRISPASVRRALDLGHDPDQLLDRLNAVSDGASALPQPLTYLLKDTARTHGRIRVIRSTCCLRSDDETLVLELANTRSLIKIGLRRIAPTVLISTADTDTVLAALRNAGYAPTLEAATGTTVIQRPTRERLPRTAPAHTAPTHRRLPHPRPRCHHGTGPRPSPPHPRPLTLDPDRNTHVTPSRGHTTPAATAQTANNPAVPAPPKCHRIGRHHNQSTGRTSPRTVTSHRSAARIPPPSTPSAT